MKSLKQFTSSALLATVMIYASGINAQTASGTSPAACTQNGQTVTCTTTTTFNLPSGTNLQAQTGGNAFTLATGIVTPVAPSGCAVTPASQSATIGSAPTLSVACSTGSGNYTFQWSKNGTNISGATSQAYTLSPNTDTSTANSSSYGVVVSNSVGSVSATPATVNVSTQSVAAPSSCSVTPASPSVPVGSSQTLSASCAVGTSPFNYAWYKGGTQIVGAISSSYTLTSADTASAGSQTYRVDISNASGASSASSTVNISPVSSCSNNGSANSVIDVNVGYKQVGSSNLFGTANTYIVRLDVGASSTTVGGLTALLSHTEGVGSQRAFRTVSLSPCAGDFTSSAAVLLSTNSVGSTTDLSINDPGRGVPNLTTGTWYVNVKNTACTANTRCDVLIDWLHY
jgi:hypothetical protein